jgi:hypothetical protein
MWLLGPPNEFEVQETQGSIEPLVPLLSTVLVDAAVADGYRGQHSLSCHLAGPLWHLHPHRVWLRPEKAHPQQGVFHLHLIPALHRPLPVGPFFPLCTSLTCL